MSHCYEYGHNVTFSTFVACHNVALCNVLMSHGSALKEPPLVTPFTPLKACYCLARWSYTCQHLYPAHLPLKQA
jgi:hypothetical protein